MKSYQPNDSILQAIDTHCLNIQSLVYASFYDIYDFQRREVQQEDQESIILVECLPLG